MRGMLSSLLLLWEIMEILIFPDLKNKAYYMLSGEPMLMKNVKFHTISSMLKRQKNVFIMKGECR